MAVLVYTRTEQLRGKPDKTFRKVHIPVRSNAPTSASLPKSNPDLFYYKPY